MRKPNGLYSPKGTIFGGVDSAAESGGPERSPSGVRRSPSESGGTPPNIFSGGVPPSAAVFRRTPLGSERSSAGLSESAAESAPIRGGSSAADYSASGLEWSSAGLSESAAESALIRGGTADLPPRTTPPAGQTLTLNSNP